MVRDGLSQKLKGEAKRLHDKQRLVDEIHKHYSKYGDTVVAVIAEHTLKEGGLRVLLRKLALHMPHDAQKQHDVLTQFLRLHGQKEFLERTGDAKTSKEAISAEEEEATSAKEDEAATEWPFVERRSGLERRDAVDRRDKVDLITFKNRRYGRDRRSGKDRRQNPPFVPKNKDCWKPKKK
jgi:hypothetical protein